VDGRVTPTTAADVAVAAACSSTISTENSANKLAFHDADTDTDSPNTATILRPTHAIPSRGSSRGSWCRCRRRGMRTIQHTDPLRHAHCVLRKRRSDQCHKLATVVGKLVTTLG